MQSALGLARYQQNQIVSAKNFASRIADAFRVNVFAPAIA